MKRNRSGRRRRAVPAPSIDRSAAKDADAVEAERRDSKRTGLQFLAIAAFLALLAMVFFAAGYRLGMDIALVAAWFCSAFGLAWWITAAAHRIPFFARWTVRTLALPQRFRPSSVLAHALWFFIFVGGLILAVRALGL